jgi:hypothetical protein
MTGPVALDEALERLLPHCDDSVFKVADWLNNHAKLGEVIILGDGKTMHPASVPGMVKVDGFMSPTGKPYLKIQVPYAKQWAFEREGFEKHCPGKPKGRRGRKPYDREKLLATALVHIVVDGVPTGRDGKLKLDGRDGLFDKLERSLGEKALPERSTLYEVFKPIVEEIVAARQAKSLGGRKK